MDETARQNWVGRAQATWDGKAARWNARSNANAVAADRPAELNRIWQELRLRPGASLLDAGCGGGQFALAFAALGVQVAAIDLSPEMIRLARENTRHQESLSAISWAIGSIDDLPFPGGSFDAIHARMVLPFVPDIPATLREFRRVLRAEGRILVSAAGPLSPIYQASWRRHLPDESGCNFVLPWELEQLLQDGDWAVLAEWGERGADARGVGNTTTEAATGDLLIQQATATTWTIIAG